MLVARMGPRAKPVDLPRRRVELEIGRRRHRRITGAAGLLLFVCLFLPAVKGCSEPVYPITMPMFWHPYLYGIVLAVGAATLTTRGLRYTIVALRVLAWLTVIGGGMLAITEVSELGIAEILLGGLLVAVIGTRGYSERRLAMVAIVVGALSLIWFGLWAVSPDGLIGVYLSTIASLGLLAGGLIWLGELAVLDAAPIVLPHAQARRRG